MIWVLGMQEMVYAVQLTGASLATNEWSQHFPIGKVYEQTETLIDLKTAQTLKLSLGILSF